MLTIFCDSDMDITPEVAARYGFKLISMPYSLNGVTVFPYETPMPELHAFYEGLRAGDLPTTSGVSEEKYKQYFRPEFEKGNDILYVHFSAAMSCTFEAMNNAVAELKAEFPERNFYTIDTKGITIISYAIACEIGDMYLAGASLDDILKWARVEVDKFAQYFFADDLKFFKRSGRVSGFAAIMGNLIGIRPIIYMTPDGRMVSLSKERGRARALNRLLSYMEELGEDIDKHRIIIGHTDAPEMAAELKNMIIEKFGDGLDIVTITTNPTSGSHCGPDGVGVAFHCSHR